MPGTREVELDQGHRVRVRELPVRRAGIYAPGGRYPYPSSVVMGVVTARAAGVEQVVVAAPAHDVILAACALCEADEVYRMGGAQAIAALAYGTEEIEPVDVVAGPATSTSRRPSGRCSARSGSTASPARATWWSSPRRAPTRTRSRSTCWPRPSTGTTRS